MNYLLDTHAYLWALDDSAELSSVANEIIEDTDNRLVVSIASLWEIAIKISIGKLQVNSTLFELTVGKRAQFSVRSLSITPAHLDVVSRLPMHHRDPFDRLLVARALVEELPIVSGDTALDAYGIERLW